MERNSENNDIHGQPALSGRLAWLPIIERYRTLFDNMTEGFALHEIVCDEQGEPVDYRFLDINPAFERLTGLKRNHVIGATKKSVMPNEDPKWLQTYAKVVRTGEAVRFDNFSVPLGRHYEVYAYSPAPRQFATIFSDITDRKRAEDALRQSEARANAILEAATESIWLFDTQYNILAANTVAARRWNMTPEEMIGKNVFDIQTADVADARRAILDAVVRTGEAVHFEDRRKDIVFYHSAYPVRDSSGEVCGITVFSRDITDGKRAEEALHETGARLKAIFDASTESIWLFDTEYRILAANTVAARRWNMTPEEMIGKNAFSLQTFDGADARRAILDTVIRSGEPVQFEDRRHGIVFDHSAYPVRDSSGAVVGLTIFSRDITARKMAEEAVRESEERLRSVLDSSLNCIYRINLQTQRYEFISSSASRIIGFTPDELMARGAEAGLASIHADDLPAFKAGLVRLEATGQELLEYRQRTKKGEYRYFANHIRLIRDGAGEPLYRDGCISDVTEQKQAEEALKSANRLLNDVIDGSTTPIFLKDIDGKFITINAALEKMLGVSREEIKGKTDNDIAPKELADSWRSNDAKVIETGKAVQIEEVAELPDGHHVFLANKFPLMDAHGKIYGVGAISHDITERMQAAEELQRLTRTLKAHTNSSSAVIHGQDEAHYLAEVCRIIVEDCGHAMVWIGYVQDDEARSVLPVACAGFEEGYLETVNVTWADTDRGQGPMGIAIRTGKPSGWFNCLTDPRFEPWRGEALKRGYASNISIPLMSNGRAFGAIAIYSSQVNPFESSETELLVRLAEDLAYGIMSLRLRDEVDVARASAELHSAELESFVSNLADGVTQIAPDGRIVWMNDVGREILGLPPEEDFSNWESRVSCFTLEGKPLPTEQIGVTRALRGERVTDFRYKMVTPYGHTIVVSASASPMFDSQGRIIGATSTFRDQSERVAFENDKTRMLDREHRIAQMLQEALIPFQIPMVVAGCHFAARYAPALDEANVGGDFYDVFDLGNDKVAVLIGDVAGKGVSAAMQVSAARYAFRSYAYIADSPARVVGLVNEALCKDQQRNSKILTAFFAIVNPKDHTVTYASAGHEPPVMRLADGQVIELNTNGMVLGAFPGFDYPEGTCRFDAGDIMLLFTDGITEARSKKMGMLGKCGVMQLLADEQGPPSVLVDKLLEKAKEYCDGRLLDDVAIVAVAQE